MYQVFTDITKAMNVIDTFIENNGDLFYKNVSNALQNNNVNEAIYKFNVFMKEMHQSARTRRSTPIQHYNNNATIMNNANSKFKRYCENLISGNIQEIQHSLFEYQSAKKLVTHGILQEENEKWRILLQNKSSKDLWTHRLEGKYE